MIDSWDLAIIGGGASGLMAGGLAARQGLRTVVLEKQPRVGRKLLATGNGTCNITNQHAAPAHYHGADAAFVAAVLDRFSPEEACRYFASIGLECIVRPDGRAYPRCEQAAAVLDCLRLELAAAGAVERTNAAVEAVRPGGGGFTLQLAEETLQARRVLICAGGAAAPGLGGGTGGYGLLTALGHRRTPLFPSIVQVKTDTTFVRSLKGVRVDGLAAFALDGRLLAAETGEILFTEYGLSGPAVMQISRGVGDWERRPRGKMEAVLDLLPDMPLPLLTNKLFARRELPSRTLEDYLTGLVHKRLGQTALRAAGLSLSRPADSLTDPELRVLAALLKGWRIPVTGTQGFGGAQVTAGGIAAEDFNPQTLESRLVPGLYAAGEVLDVDGDCGGFNLQWAWASAWVSVHAVADAAMRQRRKAR